MTWTIFMYLAIGFGTGVILTAIAFLAWMASAMKGESF